MEQKSAQSSEVRMSELMTPDHANFLGQVFGGSILALLDKVAYVTASRYAETVCVTASFDRVDFHSPINVGELVHFVGKVVYVGRTSLQVLIEVFAENIHSGSQRHTNTCTATMVAINESKTPVEVPRLLCESIEDKIAFLEGKARRRLAQEHKQEFENLKSELQKMSEDQLTAEIKS